MSQAVFTLFPNAKSLQGEVKIISLAELAALASRSFKTKLEQPLAVPDQLPNDNRRAGNEPIVSTGVFLDFDKPVDSYEGMHKALKKLGLAHVIYPTFSWSKQLPKYRVFLPLAAPGLEPHERRHLVARIMQLIPGIAPESLDSKRGYFVGCNGIKGPKPLYHNGKLAGAFAWPDAPPPPKEQSSREISLHNNPARKAQDLYAKLGHKLRDGEGRWSAVEYLATRVSAREYSEDQCYAFLSDMIARYFDPREITDKDRAKWEARVRYWHHKDVIKRQRVKLEPAKPRVMPQGLPETFSAEELLAMDLPPTQWIIESLLPPGLCVIAGRPKIGKSQFAYTIALCVAAGIHLLNKFTCRPAQVIYYDLESGHHLLKERLGPLMLALGLNKTSLGGRLSFSIISERGSNAVKQLREDLKRDPDTRLIVVDIFTAIRDLGEESAKRVNAYVLEHDLVKQFSDICLENPNLCLMLITHTNKRQPGPGEHWQVKVSGSYGITGGAHTVMSLDSPAPKANMTEEEEMLMRQYTILNIAGKRIADTTYTLHKSGNGSTWELSDKTPAQVRATTLQQEIQAYLKANEGLWSAPEVATFLGRNVNTIKEIMRRMAVQRQIVSPTGKGYCLPQATNEQRATRSPRVGKPRRAVH